MVRKCKEAKLFLIIALVTGLLLVFLIPPLNGPDETVHFLNSYALSRGDLFPDVVDNSVYGHYVPERILNYTIQYPGTLWGNRDAKISYSTVIGESLSKDDVGGNVLAGHAVVFTGYVAAGAGMAAGTLIGNILGASEMSDQPYNQMIFGRLGNLLFYVYITYLALCITPRFKRTLLLVATMPMSLFLACTLSYDALVMPVTFFFVAVVLYMMTTGDKVIAKGEIAAVLFSVFFLVGAKQAYAPLLIILLAIPKTKYGSVKKMIYCIAAVAVTAVIAYVPVMIYNHGAASVPANGDILAAQQAQREWARGNIGGMIQVFFNTLRIKGAFYVQSFWGVLGWMDTPFPMPMVTMALCIMILVGLLDICDWEKKEYGAFWKRLLPVIGCLVTVIGITLVMYLDYTPRPDVLNEIGSEYVEGVQGRYFIPLLIPLLMAFSNGALLKLLNHKNEKVQKHFSNLRTRLTYAAEGWAVMCGAYTILIVLLRYWI